MKFFLFFILAIMVGTIYQINHTIHEEDNLNFNCLKNIDINQSDTFEASVVALGSNEVRKLIAVGYESGLVDVYNANNGTKYMSFNPPTFDRRRSNILNFSHNGKYLTVGSDFDDATYIYDMDIKSLIAQLPKTRDNEIFTPNDHFLILVDGEQLKIYNLLQKEWINVDSIINTTIQRSITALALNEDGTQLAIGRFGGSIELYSVQYTPTSILISPISTNHINVNKRFEVSHIWFQNNQLIALTQLTEFIKNSPPIGYKNIEIWSIPNFNKNNSLLLNAEFGYKAIMSKNKKYIVSLGIKEHRKEGRFFVEVVDLEKKVSNIVARINTNFPSITEWPITDASDQNNDIIFIEHNHKKMLLQLSEPAAILENMK